MTMTSRDMLVEHLLERVLVGQADDLLHQLSALEQKKRRNPADAEAHRRRRVLVDVHLGDHHLAVVIVGQLVYGRREAAAGTTPFRPEINQDGLAGIDRLLERSVSENCDL